jgi:hypothetical protein
LLNHLTIPGTVGCEGERAPVRFLALRNGWRTRLLIAALAVAAPIAAAADLGPQGVVRKFCQADGLGLRVNVRGWAEVAPLVSWTFEPAWDHVVLITGYSVGPPRPTESGNVIVNVTYGVVGQLSARGLDTSDGTESVAFEVHVPEEAGWRITGPPPAPHIFNSRVDVDSMRQSLETGGVNFLADTLFIWQMFRSAGWNVALTPTFSLLDGSAFRAVDRPAVGDVVVYLRDGHPYHVGLLEAENQVVSSTLNAGIVRTATDAFAGDIKYLRLIEPDAAEDESVHTAFDAGAPRAVVPPGGAPRPRPARTPTPELHKKKATPKAGTSHVRKPLAAKRAKPAVRKKAKRPRATPTATDQPR